MPYSSATLAGLDQRLVERCGDNSTFWVSEERRDALNEAISVFQSLTGFWPARAPVGGDGTNFYTVPKQLAAVSRVTFNGATLMQTSLPELDYMNPAWVGVTGVPEFWAPNGINEIAVYPAPVGGVLLLEGMSEAPWLLSSGAFIDLGDEELTALLQYGQHFLSFKEAGAELEATTPLMQAFLAAGGDRNARLRATSFYRRWAGLNREAEQRTDKIDGTPGGARA